MGYQITVSIICLLLTVLYFLRFGLKYKVIPPSLSETSYIMGKYWYEYNIDKILKEQESDKKSELETNNE